MIRYVNARDSQHMSVIFAVSNTRGLVHHSFKEGGYRTTDFVQFLEQTSHLVTDRTVVFIFDNAPSHAGARNASLQPNHSYRFQPPYSPFFNLCEGSFSIWKAAFKREMAQVRDHILEEPHDHRLVTMMQLAEQSIASVTPEKVSHLNTRLLAILPSCLTEQNIDAY